MRNRLTLPVRNYSAKAESPASNWKTFNDNAIGIGVLFAGFSTVTGAFVYFVGNQVQHVEKQVGNVGKKIDNLEKRIDLMLDHVDKKIDNLEKRMTDNHKELMAAINPLVVKVLVLEERFADIRNK
jgi:hypothetical protein